MNSKSCLSRLDVARGYRLEYRYIAASLSKMGLLRLFAKASPAFVAIVIISGLIVQAFTWEQLGESKTELLGMAVIPYVS